MEWKKSANSFLVDGPISRQTSMGHTAWYAHLDIRRLAHVPVQNFLAFLISLDFAFLMFARSAFFCDGTSMDTGSRPLRQSGYDYGNGKVLPFWRHGGKVLHSESLVFPGSAPRHIPHHLAFFFTGGFLMVYD